MHCSTLFTPSTGHMRIIAPYSLTSWCNGVRLVPTASGYILAAYPIDSLLGVKAAKDRYL